MDWWIIYVGESSPLRAKGPFSSESEAIDFAVSKGLQSFETFFLDSEYDIRDEQTVLGSWLASQDPDFKNPLV